MRRHCTAAQDRRVALNHSDERSAELRRSPSSGEFHALRWRHVDLAAGEVRIETRVDAHRTEDVTKTIAGMREIPLSAEVVAQLKAWKVRSPFSKPSDLIFPNRRGQYESHDNLVKRRFRPLFATLEALSRRRPR